MRQLRHIGLVEGTSTLLLLIVAMPLKHFAEMPKAVSIVGMIHGVLFILYVIALIRAALALKRPFKWLAKLFIAAIIPFGPFAIERGLRREEQALRETAQATE